MSPVLFTFRWGEGQVAVQAYGASMATGAVVVLVLGFVAGVRRQLPARSVAVVLAAAAVATLVGARLFHAALNAEVYRQWPELLVNVRPAGFALEGGLLLAVATGWYACRLVRINPWPLADALAAPVALAGAIMRLGCFLNGCCFGRSTTLPWGVTYPIGSRVHAHQATNRMDILLGGPIPVHPMQLYEASALLMAAAIALLAARLRPPDGVVALSLAAWFVAFRWFNGLFHADETRLLPLAVTTILWLLLIAVGLAALRQRQKETTSISLEAERKQGQESKMRSTLRAVPVFDS